MSQANVDLVRKTYAAFNRGDYETVAGALHPEIEWRPYLGALEGSVYRGRDEIREMWLRLEDGFGDSFHVEIQELVDWGDRVLIVLEASAKGPGSGVEVRQSWVQAATMRDGLVFRVEPFSDLESARKALGRQSGNL
jgi:ketosteroid isomerase-like protein